MGVSFFVYKNKHPPRQVRYRSQCGRALQTKREQITATYHRSVMLII